MSVFDLKGSSGGNNWNYSKPQEEGYMEMIEGTVVEISNPQSINFNTKQPETWPDGNPKRNLRLTIKGKSGRELNWTFAPRSVSAEACLAALDPQGTRSQVNIEELLGKFIRVQTQAGVYNSQNPRPWWVTLLGDGDAGSVRGMVDFSAQQPQQPMQQQPAPQPQQAPQQQPAPQIQYAQQQAAQALGYQQQSAPQQQMPQQPVQQQAPANQVPYEQDPTGGYYDQDIPF